MSLKELTMEQHRDAERQKFASILMSGNISQESYLRYLVNQFACYSALEMHNYFQLFPDDLKRSCNIEQDISELKQNLGIENSNSLSTLLTDSTREYVTFVKAINTEDDFIAHVYVRYLGDLRGGQIIAKKIPGKGMYYQFDNPNDLAQSIYMKLNDDMAEEARNVFRFATRLFVEMYDSIDEGG
tara:strand:+ start:11 stop:565 length:555 start_codon:yes stop_codon:yes gene_type:complete